MVHKQYSPNGEEEYKSLGMEAGYSIRFSLFEEEE